MSASQADGSIRPTGADEIRAAVIRAAATRFAADGLRATLRDVAADAKVNVGLIHRHIGNKDDLVRAVLASQSRAGATGVRRADDLGTAFRWIFDQLGEGGAYVRILAWLLLDGSMDIRDQLRDYPTVRALREKEPPGDDVSLMAAMAMVYGWAVFGDELLTAFGHELPVDAAVRARLGAIAASVATGS